MTDTNQVEGAVTKRKPAKKKKYATEKYGFYKRELLPWGFSKYRRECEAVDIRLSVINAAKALHVNQCKGMDLVSNDAYVSICV